MIKELRIPLFDLVLSLSNAMDLVSPAIVGHHKRVAHIALSIGMELGLSVEQQRELVLAGALHDSGPFSLKDRLDTLAFELESPHKHAESGYLLLQTFKNFSNVAHLIRYHHVPWNDGSGRFFKGKEVPIESHILHLADRIAVLINRKKEVLAQVRDICQRIKEHSGRMFMPELVEGFMNLSTKEYFWLDLVSATIDSSLSHKLMLTAVELDMESLLNLGKLFSHIIDFRSRFTAVHSAGVAASAEAIARFVGFSERECLMMKLAGYLHDLGKLAVPTEILEKPANLTEKEFNVIRSHAFYTYRCLEPISELDVINEWASLHHERIDGNGYPFHHKGQDLSLGSRIMAVADVFTALTEDRPYRKGMERDKTLQLLQQMAENSALDSGVVAVLSLHFEEISSLRAVAQESSKEEYQRFSFP